MRPAYWPDQTLQLSAGNGSIDVEGYRWGFCQEMTAGKDSSGAFSLSHAGMIRIGS